MWRKERGTYSGSKSWQYRAKRPGLFLSRLGIHTSGPSACCDVMKAVTAAQPWGGKKPVGGGLLQEIPRSSQASEGSRR